MYRTILTLTNFHTICLISPTNKHSKSRVLHPENSLVWHQQVLGWLNRYSGVEKKNPSAVSLDDTVIPVVDYNP
jgi:hypothetical protein